MIHRDVKPTNIFLCRMGNEFDFVKVLDFGLVKVMDDEGQLSRQGATMGTPAYMAPELAMEDARIDGRCDLYGLGCVAYWLLTGRMVFEERSQDNLADILCINHKLGPVSSASGAATSRNVREYRSMLTA
jgi:serine/threonine protein kinase